MSRAASAAHVVGVGGVDGAEPVGLRLDGLDHPRVLVADVGEDQLAGEVQVLVAVVVVDVAALGSGDGHRRQVGLGGPGVEHVGPVARQEGGLGLGVVDGFHGAKSATGPTGPPPSPGQGT